uniref:Uncharacterized protein n=1 Tax=Meloidogyne enterolobii TaxID=390850 RepID=A0A6V7V822_MELEN|nr:unnamed protein product [Meloidogyne enterolobii]
MYVFRPPLFVTTCCTAFPNPCAKLTAFFFATFGIPLTRSLVPSSALSIARSKEVLDECPVENWYSLAILSFLPPKISLAIANKIIEEKIVQGCIFRKFFFFFP